MPFGLLSSVHPRILALRASLVSASFTRDLSLGDIKFHPSIEATTHVDIPLVPHCPSGYSYLNIYPCPSGFFYFCPSGYSFSLHPLLLFGPLLPQPLHLPFGLLYLQHLSLALRVTPSSTPICTLRATPSSTPTYLWPFGPLLLLHLPLALFDTPSSAPTSQPFGLLLIQHLPLSLRTIPLSTLTSAPSGCYFLYTYLYCNLLKLGLFWPLAATPRLHVSAPDSLVAVLVKIWLKLGLVFASSRHNGTGRA